LVVYRTFGLSVCLAEREGNTSSLYKADRPNSMMVSANEMPIMTMMTKEAHFRYVGPTENGKARKPETLLDYIKAAVKRSLISSDLQRLISIDPCRCCQIVDADLGGYWICFGKVFICKTLYKPSPETCSIFPSL
jgi:hypothetical protein